MEWTKKYSGEGRDGPDGKERNGEAVAEAG